MAEKTSSRWGSAARTIAMLILTVATVICLRTMVQATVVNGHSMDPTYATGDLLISMKAPSYKIGDVITYHPSVITNCPLCNIVHRIVKGNATTGWITKGDNNPNEDGWLIPNNTIVGHVIMRIHLPPFARIAYLPSFWITITTACIAIWLMLKGFDYFAEDEEEVETPEIKPATKGVHPKHRSTEPPPPVKHRLTA